MRKLKFSVRSIFTSLLYGLLLTVLCVGCGSFPQPGSQSSLARPRVIVTTDGEVDDRSSFIRFLLYSTDYDVEGIIATNSVWQKDGHGTDWIIDLIDIYEQVRPNLLRHDFRYPEAAQLKSVVILGNENRNKMHEVGPNNDTPGSQHIIDVLLDKDPRPVWLQAWGGTNTIAQALWRLRESYSESDFQRAVKKARIYAIADQDQTIWWIRDEVPQATLVLNYQFTAINYQHEGHPYSDHPMFSKAWMQENIKKNHGKLGAAYPQEYFSEGDSPAFFHLIDTGLRSTEHLSFGGWGGRFVQIDPNRPNFWRDAEDDGDSLKPLWRWLPEITKDFAARIDWTMLPSSEVNHPPIPVISGTLDRTVSSGDVVYLNAEDSRDPDGDSLTYRWWMYEEPGSYKGGLSIKNADQPSTAFMAPEVMETEKLHIILEVKDQGSPVLTRYERIIVTVRP